MFVLALYLPQYHCIPENNCWWGEGYTEWTAVKNAVPLFKGHNQPKIPLNSNYYDLSEENASTLKWQSEVARKFGIDGFCFYHYWFGSKKLLEKPMEILLSHSEIDIKYCICWANETWTRAWYDKTNEVLIKQEYGDENDWEKHFNYLLQFFKDKRYIKINNRPLVNIYKPSDIKALDDMLSFWNKLAIDNGFDGLFIVGSKNSIGNGLVQSKFVNAYYHFEPGYSTRNGLNFFEKISYFGKIALKHFINIVFKTKLFERKISFHSLNSRIIRNYKKSIKNSDLPVYPGLCPCWDNTPRRGRKGAVYTHDSAAEFENALKKINSIVKDDTLVYINAWNEWGEGCHLEPDETIKFGYLEAIQRVKKQ